MRILIVCDTLDGWSTQNRALALQKYAPQHEFTIRGHDRRHNYLHDHKSFDVIHFNFSGALTEAYDWILQHKEKCLLTAINERSWDGFLVNTEKYRHLLKTCRTVTVNRRMAELCGGTYIPNGIDPDLFQKHHKPVVGYAGTGRPNKNWEAIRDACKRLGLEFRGQFYERGQGKQLPHDKMQDFYNGLTVYVHASLTEGFNNTILEALACNIPVLMTKQGAWKEFEGWVEFIEPDTVSIEAALRKYCGRQLILQKFTWDKLVPLYVAQYESIAHDNNSLARTPAVPHAAQPVGA